MGYPDYRLARSHKTKRRTSGHILLNATAGWTNVDTGLDVKLEAEIGDVLEAAPCMMIGNETPVAFFDAVTLDGSGNPYWSFANQAAVTAAPPGYSPWRAPTSQYSFLGPPLHLTLAAGDIDSTGQVTVRLRYVCDTSAGKYLYGNGTDYKAEFTVKNLGPEDPY